MIEIEFDMTHFDYIVKNIESMPIRDFLRDLMKEAKQIVTTAYSSQGAGNTDFKASIRTTKNNTATLTVRGEDVGFLEFGAGVDVSLDDFTDQVDFFVSPGSYSIFNARSFIDKGFWVYAKVWYKGIPSTKGMQQALDYLRDNILPYMRKRIASWLVNGK